MKKLAIVFVVFGLALGACKKEEKDGGDKGKVAEKKEGDQKEPAKKEPEKKVDPAAKTDPAADPAAKVDPAQDPAPAGDEFKMAYKAPSVGQKATHESTGKMTMNVDAGAEKVQIGVTRTAVEHFEIVEVNGDLVTKLKVHYATNSRDQAIGGKSQTIEEPTHGKAYVVWDEGGKLTATHDDGSKVSDEELKELNDDFGAEVGRIRPEARVITGHAWKKGEPYELTADELKAFSEKDPKTTAVKGVFTFLGEENGVASFEMVLTMQTKDGEMEIGGEAKAVVKLDVASSRPIELKVTGTIAGKMPGKDGLMPYDGAMEETETYSYQ